MFKNYLKIALRNIRREKGFSFINIFGLALGMACCLLILLWVRDELSYDRFHSRSGDTYRALIELRKGLQPEVYSSHTGPGIAQGLEQTYPEVIHATRFTSRFTRLVSYQDKSFEQDGFGFTDPAFFKIFTFPFKEGDPESALSQPFSMVITEALAQKYFGDEDPMGKTLRVENQFDFQVTGILRDIPENSHLKFNLLVPFPQAEDLMPEYGRFAENPHFHFFRNYVLLKERTSLVQMNDKVHDFLRQGEYESPYNLWLQPITRIHLHPHGIRDVEKRGNINNIYVFTAAAFFILIVACINFINLMTARSERRAKEIGMRKVVGAGRMEIIRQFFGESLLMSFSALIVAIGAVAAVLPIFGRLVMKRLSLTGPGVMPVLLEIMAIGLITGVAAGIYPALFLSSFKPARVLKSDQGRKRGRMIFRRVLVTFQFAVSIFLIIATLITSRQYRYMQDLDLGYDRQNLVYLPLKGRLAEQREVLRTEMKRDPHVLGVSYTSSLLTRGAMMKSDLDWEGRPDEVVGKMGFVSVDRDFFETMGIPLMDGHDFTRHVGENPPEEYIVNQSAAEIIGEGSPVGKPAGFAGARELRGSIVGLAGDYNFMSLQNEISPLVLVRWPQRFQFTLVRIGTGSIPQTLRFLEDVCARLEPGFPFECHFVDEALDNLYMTERQMGRTFCIFAVLAIMISCLGLVGLVSFIVERRSKEVGIRKVLGASVTSIVRLMSREFVLLVLTANLLAWPLAWYFSKKWLRAFAYRIPVDVITFVAAAAAVVIITLLTVSGQSIKAASANPVDALKYE